MKEIDKEIMVTKIKSMVKDYLDFCNESNTPYICKLKNKKGGRETIEKFVLKCVFENKYHVAEALSVYERILDPNYLTD